MWCQGKSYHNNAFVIPLEDLICGKMNRSELEGGQRLYKVDTWFVQYVSTNLNREKICLDTILTSDSEVVIHTHFAEKDDLSDHNKVLAFFILVIKATLLPKSD